MPAPASAALADRGVLGSVVLWFERDDPDAGARCAYAAGDVARVGDGQRVHPRPADGCRFPARRARPGPGRSRAARAPAGAGSRCRCTGKGRAARFAAGGEALAARADRPRTRACDAYVAAAFTGPGGAGPPADAFGDSARRTCRARRTIPLWRLPVADAAGEPVSYEQLRDDPRVARLARLLSEGCGCDVINFRRGGRAVTVRGEMRKSGAGENGASGFSVHCLGGRCTDPPGAAPPVRSPRRGRVAFHVRSTFRRAMAVIALAPVCLFGLIGAAQLPASADVGDHYTPARSTWRWRWAIFVGIPLGFFLMIASLPCASRGGPGALRYRPGSAVGLRRVWFGAPPAREQGRAAEGGRSGHGRCQWSW